MKICTYITNPNEQGFQELKRSYPDIIVLQKPEQGLGKGILDKVKAMHSYCVTLPVNEVIAFCDGYDVVVMDNPENIERRFLEQDCDILVNAEKALWTPDLESLRGQYDYEPQHVGNWLYLNSGVYIGYAGKIANMLAIMLYMFEKKTETADDQAAMNLVYLSGKLNIKLDTACAVMQCYSFIGDMDFVYEPSKVINNITGSTPAFIHGNGKTDMTKAYAALRSGFDYQVKNWVNTEDWHKLTNEAFALMIDNPLSKNMRRLCELRNYVEQNAYGFGERSFMSLWYILMDKLPQENKCLEIGVFRGQSLAALAMSAEILGKNAHITGVSLFEKGINIDWDFSEQDTLHLFKEHGISTDNLRLVKGNSADLDIVVAADDAYDLVYVDGDHSYNGALLDLQNYAPMVKKGGFLVVDDCCTDLKIPFGMFGGVETVTSALNDFLTDEWKFLFSVVHIKVYQRL